MSVQWEENKYNFRMDESGLSGSHAVDVNGKSSVANQELSPL